MTCRIDASWVYKLARLPPASFALWWSITSNPSPRHGPREIVGENVTVVHLAGGAADIGSNTHMLADVERVGGHAVWLGSGHNGDGPVLPEVADEAVLPVAEILPLQLLSVALAERKSRRTGIVPPHPEGHKEPVIMSLRG